MGWGQTASQEKEATAWRRDRKWEKEKMEKNDEFLDKLGVRGEREERRENERERGEEEKGEREGEMAAEEQRGEEEGELEKVSAQESAELVGVRRCFGDPPFAGREVGGAAGSSRDCFRSAPYQPAARCSDPMPMSERSTVAGQGRGQREPQLQHGEGCRARKRPACSPLPGHRQWTLWWGRERPDMYGMDSVKAEHRHVGTVLGADLRGC